jgi:hypothetical protein
MTQHKRMAGIVIVVALGLAAPGCGKKGQSTPQEAFDAFKNAAAKEDWKAFTECLTNDSRKVMAGSMVAAVVMMKQFAEGPGKAEFEAKLKPLNDVMKKYDLKEDAFKDAFKEIYAEAIKGGGDAEGGKKALIKLGESIKDPGAFMGDVASALKQFGRKDDMSKLAAFKEAVVKDVKTSGDTATGTIVLREGGSEKSDTIHFRKEEGVWRIDMVEMITRKRR